MTRKSLLLSCALHGALFAGFFTWSSRPSAHSTRQYDISGDWTSAPPAARAPKPARKSEVAERSHSVTSTENSGENSGENSAETATAASASGEGGTALAGPQVTESLRQIIARHLRYPRALQARGVRGEVQTRFSLDPQGQITAVEVVSADATELAELVQNAIHAGTPYPQEFARANYIIRFEFTLR